MASIKFSRKEFEKQVKLTPEIEEKIRLFGTPLDSIDKDTVTIEIFPNRPDLLSMHGYLRAFKAFIGKDKGLKEYRINKAEKDFKVIIDSSVDKVRPYTACAIVKNLAFTEEKIKEIIDLQEKLHSTIGRNRKKMAIGIYPLDKIQLPIKYQALSPDKIRFRPLEADREMSAREILERHPTGKEYAHLLSNQQLYPVFLDAKGKILSMPPIINSHDTGRITQDTKEVFIECSGFDFDALSKTLNIIVTTLAEQGGKVYQMELGYKKKITTPDLSVEKKNVSVESANKLLGLNLKEAEIATLLERMGYAYSKKSVSVPAWRVDVMHEVDVIEDIAIAYGYDKLIPTLPSVSTIAMESPMSRLKSRIAEILLGLGIVEISSYHLIKAEESKEAEVEKPIEVENSKTEYKILRPNLLVPALRILAENKDNEYPQKIFELGTVFRRNRANPKEIQEGMKVAIALTPGQFTEGKQVMEYLFAQLDLPVSFTESEHPLLISGRTASISLNKENLGFMGEVHPDTLKSWNMKLPAVVMEISLDKILEQLKKN
jgi:phenylalanyl-tRNA synthetase beta chain